ncbi:tetratricopeptide repeat protein [Corallococcus sp. AB030]|uniref:tetratricopeptide repeat protein n=1 Tax=Corallococcus sp. AB030 TaxID=2316716 RepID=UPI000EC13196|nr:tetratricopeptide repeat protein [Corallococcus sp. AB030]RKI06839.1 tetratricopeptide repeat protein [Corallococcus sp. AB030]
MRRLLQELQERLEDFIEQREDLLLLVQCSENDTAILLKLLRDTEQASEVDVFLLFSNSFHQPREFVREAIEQLQEQHGLASQSLLEAGKPPLPDFPQTLLSPSRSPQALLQEAISFARSLFPREGGHRLVWVMLPEQISDAAGYAALVASLVPRNGIQPWMQGLRLILRNPGFTMGRDTNAPRLPRVSILPVDLSPDAVRDSLQRDVEDDERPRAERMQALMTLACLDYAHGRNKEATAKYTALLNYYQETENHSMQAMVMHGIGDVFRRTGANDQALHWYECALVPAIASKAPVILSVVVKSLGEFAFERKRYSEAELYFEGLEQIAARMLDPEGKARALEWLGLCHEKQGDAKQAVVRWETAAHLSRKVGLHVNLCSNLDHLSRTYRHLRMKERLSGVETELTHLKRKGPRDA